MMGWIFYMLLGLMVGALFLCRQDGRTDMLDLIGAFAAVLFWPLYLISLVIMRVCNGDWK